jgi:hypothetical protein
MTKTAFAVLASGAALALAGTAHGKGTNVRSVCGASGCTQVAGAPPLMGWGGATTWSTAPWPYYVVHMRYGDAYWLPGPRWFADASSLRDCITAYCWTRLPTDDVALLRRATAGLEPFQPHLARVTVGGRRVADPDSYLPLLGDLHWAFARPELHGIRIALRPARPNPWIAGPAVVRYDREHRVLQRSDGYFKVPPTLAEKLEHPSLAAHRDGSTALYAGLGVTALAALGALAFAKRNRKEKR